MLAGLSCPGLHIYSIWAKEKKKREEQSKRIASAELAGWLCVPFDISRNRTTFAHHQSQLKHTQYRWRRQQSRRQWPCQIRRDHSFHSIRFATVLVRFFRVVVAVAADAENCVTVFCALVVLVVVVVPEPHGKYVKI